jgi:tetratricopeptide (TPR) repeat protein
MDVKQEYAVAFELAATGRYVEARSKLLEILQNRPAYIDALVLLGKVEYYLKRYHDSRERFETVLNYEPGNFAAYFGLEYYKERARKAVFYIAVIVLFIFFSAGTAFLYFSLSVSFAKKSGVLEQKVTQQTVQLKDLKEAIIKADQQRYKEFLKKLEVISKQVSLDIESFSSFLKSIDKRIKELKDEISRLRGEQKRVLEDFKKRRE